MRFETKFLIMVVLALVLALPIGLNAKHRRLELKIERTNNANLHIEIKNKQTEKQRLQDSLEAKERLLEQERQKSQDLKKQLQAKRAEEARKARVASEARRQALHSASFAGCGSYAGLVSQYNWNTKIAMAIMRAESTCNRYARSATHDSGLFQINDVHAAKVGGNLSSLYDPATNVRVAYQIYSASGWRPWTVYNTGAYLKFL